MVKVAVYTPFSKTGVEIVTSSDDMESNNLYCPVMVTEIVTKSPSSYLPSALSKVAVYPSPCEMVTRCEVSSTIEVEGVLGVDGELGEEVTGVEGDDTDGVEGDEIDGVAGDEITGVEGEEIDGVDTEVPVEEFAELPDEPIDDVVPPQAAKERAIAARTNNLKDLCCIVNPPNFVIFF